MDEIHLFCTRSRMVNRWGVTLPTLNLVSILGEDLLEDYAWSSFPPSTCPCSDSIDAHADLRLHISTREDCLSPKFGHCSSEGNYLAGLFACPMAMGFHQYALGINLRRLPTVHQVQTRGQTRISRLRYINFLQIQLHRSRRGPSRNENLASWILTVVCKWWGVGRVRFLNILVANQREFQRTKECIILITGAKVMELQSFIGRWSQIDMVSNVEIVCILKINQCTQNHYWREMRTLLDDWILWVANGEGLLESLDHLYWGNPRFFNRDILYLWARFLLWEW